MKFLQFKKPESFNEFESVRKAQEGDARAFESLYRLYAGRIYALCLRITGDTAMAEELTQIAFVRAWDHLPAFRGDSSFLTWLHRLATNVVLGELRTRKRLRFFDGDPDELPAAGTENIRPELKHDLEQCVCSLPPGARTVLVLHDIEGYQHDEIAEMTGVAVGTCKAQLHRARNLIREMLAA